MNSITAVGFLALIAIFRPAISWGQSVFISQTCSDARSALFDHPTRTERLAAVIEASVIPDTIGALNRNAQDEKLLIMDIKSDALNFTINQWTETHMPQGPWPDHYKAIRHAYISKASFPSQGFSIVESTDKKEAFLIDNQSVREAVKLQTNCPNPTPPPGWTTDPNWAKSAATVSDQDIKEAIQRAWADTNFEKIKAEVLKQ
jgi:hypothetical protein